MQRSQRPLGRPPKREGKLSTKETILYVATTMFLDKGYPFVSMDDVAEKSDVTKATVYYYYKTKADLFTDAMIQLMTRIKKQITSLLSTNQDLKAQLFAIAKAHLQATVDIDINTFMKEAKISLSQEQQQLMEDAERNMYDALEKALKKAMHTGEIPKSNARLSALIFMSMITIGKNPDIAQQKSLDDTVTEILQFYWNGLAN